MDEFGMGSTTRNSAFGPCLNPIDISCVPGGSSGGSAAAVSEGISDYALGSDTGGSVRQPSAWCGVCGMKPSYGRVSRYGLIAYGSSADTIGTISKSVLGCEEILMDICGRDKHDPHTENQKKYKKMNICDNLKGYKIGVLKESLEFDGLDSSVKYAFENAVDVLASLGAIIQQVSFSNLEAQCAAYYANILAEASSNLARYDGIRYGVKSEKPSEARQSFGEEVTTRIILGTYLLSMRRSLLDQAVLLRKELTDNFNTAFIENDVIILPTSPKLPHKLTYETKEDDFIDDLYTVPASMAGLPALSVPCGVGQGLPVGLQIIGKKFREETVFEVGHAYELSTKWFNVIQEIKIKNRSKKKTLQKTKN
eukprot:GHVL01020675.1.p1 GENE.GHVL01020675.1~~GHVL01020675.1.p1  ORF type:complete len:424 (-),score=101.32 GHVL01020675.1:89-1189(-)